MALMEVNFFSKALMRPVTMNVILPADKVFFGEETEEENKPFKTLYLLHGVMGNYTDWVTGTCIKRWAEEKNLAVVMPSGANMFYMDHPNANENYSEFIGILDGGLIVGRGGRGGGVFGAASTGSAASGQLQGQQRGGQQGGSPAQQAFFHKDSPFLFQNQFQKSLSFLLLYPLGGGKAGFSCTLLSLFLNFGKKDRIFCKDL